MKVEIINKEEKKLAFPKLMKHNYSNLIVLFTSPKKGTIINTDISQDLGYHYKSWSIEDYTNFEGMLTLSND